MLQHKQQRLAGRYAHAFIMLRHTVNRHATQHGAITRLQQCTSALHATAARLGAQQAAAAEQRSSAQSSLAAQQATATQQRAALHGQVATLERALEEARAAVRAQEAALGPAAEAVEAAEQRSVELAALQEAVRHGDTQQRIAAAQRDIATLQGQVGGGRAQKHKLLLAMQRAVAQREAVVVKVGR